MRLLRRCTAVSAATLFAVTTAGLAGAATAAATPSDGVNVVILSQNTVDGIEYVTREITIAPGGSTGWHYHDPIVYGIIREGTLTWASADCLDVTTYPSGSAVAEASGADHVHLGRNLGTEPLVLWANYVAPSGTSPAVNVPDPGCGFA